MQHKSFGKMPCPIARSLERVGEWWSILILRDAFYGLSRFDDFQNSLGIAPGMLTRRLSGLVKAGLLERRRYSTRPPRYEYVLTQRGRDFRPVMIAMFAWGNKHFAPEGASAILTNAKTGAAIELGLMDCANGKPLSQDDIILVPGPAATESLKKRLAFVAGEMGIDEYRRDMEMRAAARKAKVKA